MATLGPLCFVRCPQSLFAPAVTALAFYLDLYWKIEFMAFLWFCNWIIFPLQTTVSFVTNSFNRPQLLKDLLLQGLQKDTVLAGNPRQWDQFITEIGVGLGWACERSWHQGRLQGWRSSAKCLRHQRWRDYITMLWLRKNTKSAVTPHRNTGDPELNDLGSNIDGSIRLNLSTSPTQRDLRCELVLVLLVRKNNPLTSGIKICPV